MRKTLYAALAVLSDASIGTAFSESATGRARETLNKYSISTDLQAKVRRNLAEGW